MLLRWLVGNFVQSSAAGNLRELAQNALLAPTGPREAWLAAAQAAAADASVAAPTCDVAIFLATNLEAGGLVDALEKSYSGKWEGSLEHLGLLAGRRVLVVETGTGAARAAAAVTAALAFYQPAWAIAAGFASGLSDQLPRNRILISEEVVQEAGESLPLRVPFAREEILATRGLALGKLVSSERLLRTEAERRELGAQVAAVACDQETYAIAQVCASQDVPCFSIRIISEAVADALPTEVNQLLGQGNLAAKLGALSSSLLRRPRMAQELWELQGRAVAAADRLARFLASVIEQMPRKG